MKCTVWTHEITNTCWFWFESVQFDSTKWNCSEFSSESAPFKKVGFTYPKWALYQSCLFVCLIKVFSCFCFFASSILFDLLWVSSAGLRNISNIVKSFRCLKLFKKFQTIFVMNQIRWTGYLFWCKNCFRVRFAIGFSKDLALELEGTMT